jgi:hypothetical protein
VRDESNLREQSEKTPHLCQSNHNRARPPRSQRCGPDVHTGRTALRVSRHGPSRRYRHSIFVVGGIGQRGTNHSLFMLGGSNLTTATRSVYIYRLDQRGWHTGVRLPAARSHAAAVVLGRSIYVLGGLGASAATKTVWRFGPAHPRRGWTRLADMPVARASFGAAALNDKIYRHRRQHRQRRGADRARRRLRPSTNHWQRGPSLPRRTQGFASIARHAASSSPVEPAQPIAAEAAKRSGNSHITSVLESAARPFHQFGSSAKSTHGHDRRVRVGFEAN